MTDGLPMQSGAPCDEFGKSFPNTGLAIAFMMLLWIDREALVNYV